MTSQIHIKGYLVDDKGTWTVRARYTDAESGKRKLLSRSTGLKVDGHNKRKAEAMMREIVEGWEQQVNAAQSTDNPQFKDCISHWMERKKLTLRPNTLDGYRVAANKHIIPELGAIGICDLTRQELQRYFEKLQRDGISASTMKKHRVIIQGVLKDAVLDDLISVNVADAISLPKGKKFEGKALTEVQVAEMLARLETQPEPIRAAVTLAVVYGLRRSEICGLRWGDVDFENNIIHIRNTVTEYSGTVYEAETTKTKASRRDLYMIASTADYLQALKEEQAKSGIYNGKVCVHLNGHDVKPEYISRASIRFLKSCGYDGVRLHDLRHTAATILAKRVPIKQVQAYLGHEDIQTTLGIYTHVLSEDSIATSKAMGDFLNGAGFVACSESCSESTDQTPDNVISFKSIMPEKLAVK